MVNVMMLENVHANLALMESSVTHVPIIFLDFHNVEVCTARPRDTRILVPEKNRAAQNRAS